MLGKTTAAALTKARQIGGGLYGKSKENLLNLLVIVKFRKCETNFLSPRGRRQVPSPPGEVVRKVKHSSVRIENPLLAL